MNTPIKYDLFGHDGIEKAAFFRFEHEDLTPKEIIHLFAEQFGEAVDPEELITGLTVFFNVMPENFDEVFNRRCAEFIAGLKVNKKECNKYA